MTKVIIKDVLVEGWNNFSKSSREARENDDVVFIIIIIIITIIIIIIIIKENSTIQQSYCLKIFLQDRTK